MPYYFNSLQDILVCFHVFDYTRIKRYLQYDPGLFFMTGFPDVTRARGKIVLFLSEIDYLYIRGK
jgi:hypothetical protein